MIAAIYARIVIGQRVLLSLLSVLIIATSAAAESPWLLWNTYQESRSDPKLTSTEHAIVQAFESQAACQQAIQEQVQGHIKTWSGVYKRVKVSPADSAVVVAEGVRRSTQPVSKDDSLLVRVSCWPLGLQPKAILGGATYAKRDSAWVLWKESSRPPVYENWNLYEAYESKGECDAGRASYIKISLKTGERPGTTRELTDGVIVTRDNTGKEVRREEFHCLPSGTDPRPRYKPD